MKTRTSYLTLLLFIQAFGLAQIGKKEWTIDEIFTTSKFALKSLSSVQWMEEGRKFSYLETDTITKSRNLYSYSVADGKRELVMDGSLLTDKSGEKPMSIGSYQWSSDGKRILITGTLPARRVKTGGNFGVFTVATKAFRLLTDTTAEQANVKFSPDGSRVGFVRSNNIYIMDVESGREIELTADGSETILNGKFDWVYEEEFSIIDGWQWSPDGASIAFWRLDQSGVPTFPLVGFSKDDSHADLETIRYPKAGDRNSTVKIGVVNIESKETRWLDLGTNQDIYIPRIKWTNDPEVLSIQRLNRGQDTLELMLANVSDGTIKTILTETDTAWVDVQDNLVFLEKSDQFLWTSFRDGFMHIYLYNLDGSLVRQVTRGEWDVTGIADVNENRKLLYFMSTQASPLERQLYSIKLDGTGMRRLTKESGWHSIDFSPNDLVYIDWYSSAKTPTGISLRANDGTRVAQLIENKPEVFKEYPIGDQQFFSFKTPEGETLNGSMLKPADFDPSKKYPVLMHVYGVGGQDVINAWGGRTFLWYQLLAQKGYVVVGVEGRGTDGRGKRFRQVSHRQMGIPETQDQIEAAKYLGSLPYIDSTRIGIWGWSGGGYSTCMAMTMGAGYFKTGVAVAPVTDFKFYDTIWAERYMRTPRENPEGYKWTSPITYADKFKGNLLIIHGTTDDNVHWQNTITFVNELISKNKQVQTMFYPGRRHGISGDNATRHLYTMMTNYILEKL